MEPTVKYRALLELLDSQINEYVSCANKDHVRPSVKDTWLDMASGISNVKFKVMQAFENGDI